MRYIACDIETTGLDPKNDQVLEIGLVEVNDQQVCDTMQIYVYHTEYRFKDLWSIKNLDWSARMVKCEAAVLNEHSAHMPVADAVKLLGSWLEKHVGPRNKCPMAGKNFAGFDKQFLLQLDPKLDRVFGYRTLDPAILYLQPNDIQIPTLEECALRAGLTYKAHDSLSDALLVANLLIAKGI